MLGAQAYSAQGIASWYGAAFQGRKTANGESFDRLKYTAAHRSLPFGTILIVTNRENGRRVVVRVNDRGPFVAGRLIDLSEAAATAIGLIAAGTGPVSLEEAAGLEPGPLGGSASLPGVAARMGVAAPSPSAAPAPRESGEWCDIQVASFSKKENADSALAKLRAVGYQPEIARISSYYRVMLRRLPASGAAQERKRLEELGFPRVVVTVYKIATRPPNALYSSP
jgi:rare lipoprotein A